MSWLIDRSIVTLNLSLRNERKLRVAEPIFEVINVGNSSFEVMRWSSEQPEGILLPSAVGGIRGYAQLGSQLQSLHLSVAGINPRGCGKSTGPLKNVTFRELAQDVVDVIVEIATIPVLLIGHAGGNRIARMVASMRPDLVRGVVLLAAGGKVRPDEEALTALRRLTMKDYENEKHQLSLTQTALFAPGSEIPDDYWRVSDRSTKFAQAFAGALETTSVEEWWAGGQARMLVIQGKQDRIAPVGNGHDLKAQFPERVEVVDLEGAGHALYLEKTSEISHLVVDFAQAVQEARG